MLGDGGKDYAKRQGQNLGSGPGFGEGAAAAVASAGTIEFEHGKQNDRCCHSTMRQGIGKERLSGRAKQAAVPYILLSDPNTRRKAAKELARIVRKEEAGEPGERQKASKASTKGSEPRLASA